jgi:hypothetical protein
VVNSTPRRPKAERHPSPELLAAGQRLRLWPLAFSLALAGCTASIISPPVPEAAPSPAAVPNPQPVARLHLLTVAQFENSVHDLLGDDAPTSAIEPDVDIDGFASVGASQIAVSPAGVEAYESAIGGAVAFVFQSDARIASVAGCLPGGLADATCVQGALNRVGRRAFRRPLTADELGRYQQIVTEIGTDANDVREGLKYALWAMLESPSFLYRVELGESSPAAPSRHLYTGYEMAGRLAATLWQTAPDDALLDVAAMGGLSTADSVRSQATLMLADPRARAAFAVWVDDLYDTPHLMAAIKDPSVFPDWSDSLRDAMRQELLLRIDDVVFAQQGDYLSLYDAPTTFVNNQLALHYGLSVPSAVGFQKVTLPDDRRGLLGGGAWLSSYALPQRTSPTQRGRFVVQTLLCKTVPPPPPNVPAIDSEPTDGLTLRQKLEKHRQNPACASCHAMMDPIGLGLERFNSVAVARDTDNGVAIDASGELDGVPFQDAAQLATVVRQHPNAGPCFVQKLYTSAQGRSVMKADATALSGLSASFAASGHQAARALLDLVSSDAFRYVEPEDSSP